MNLQKQFCLSATGVLAALLLLLSSATLVCGVEAQSTESASGSGSLTGARAPFMVAPSFPLAGAPSGVATGDLNRDGKPDLVTIDTAAGKVTVFLGLGGGRFATGVEFMTGSHPTSVAIADLNGDGRSEVIVSNAQESTIQVLSPSGEGKLRCKQTVNAGVAATMLAVGDFAGNGRVDVAAIGKQATSMSILPNDGAGALGKPVLIVLHKAAESLIAGDFNKDGHTDLALGNEDGSLTVMLSAGDGKFRALPDVAVSSGSLSSIVAADFDRDGMMDLAVTRAEEKSISILLGKGDGSFAPPQSYRVGRHPVSALIADFDGDGSADLLVVNRGSNTFSALRGNGDGTFAKSMDFVVGKSPAGAVLGDFDGDGKIDVAVINGESQSVSVSLGYGDGSFRAGRSYSAGLEPQALASGDLNGDKLPGLVVANHCGSDPACSKGGSVDVFLAGDKGSYELAHSYPVGRGPVGVALADIDGGKHLDIVALNREDRTLSLLLAKGDGSFEQPSTFALAGAPVAVVVGDFNHDGKIDLAVLEDCGSARCSQAGSVEVLLGQGRGGFSSVASYVVGHSPVSIAVGDLNRDKTLDLVIANRCGKDASCQSSGTATVLMGTAGGKFTPLPEMPLGKEPGSIALADLTGSGMLDLVVSRSEDIAIMRGNSDGSFQAPVAYKAGNTPGALAVADFDADGKPDVAVVNTQDATVSVLFGKANGTLAAPVALSVAMGPEALIAISAVSGRHASLATANGNSGSATPGAEVSLLANVHPEVGSPTTTTLAAPSPSVSVINQSVALSASVTTGSAAAPVPVTVGTVTFLSDGTAIADCPTPTPDATGTATCNTSALDLGKHTLTADYTGTAAFTSGVSNNQSIQVSKASTTLSLTSSTASSTVDDSVTFTATLSALAPGAFTAQAPGGTISFSVATAGGTAVSPNPCSSTSVSGTTLIATCATAALPAGSYKVAANYSGDANFAGAAATPSSVSLTVNQVPTSLALSAAPASPSVDQSVTFTAALTVGASTPIAPGGTISFSVLNSGGTAVSPNPCTSTTVTAATLTATCKTNNLAAGSYKISASYSGDKNFAGAASVPVTLPVTVQPANTALTVSTNPAGPLSVGTSATLSASIPASVQLTPFAPSGMVSISVNGTAFCTVPLNATTVSCPTQYNFTIAQSYSVTATYSGSDPNFTIASGSLTVIVGKATGAQINLSSGANPSQVDQPVAFSLTVVPPTGSKIVPSGTVSFMQGSAPLCPAPIALAAGTAVCNYAFVAPSTGSGITITAKYNGDTNYAAGTSNAVQQVVTMATTTTAVSLAAPNPSLVNQKVDFTATVTPAFPASGVQTGTTAAVATGKVTLTDQSTGATMCSANLAANGTITCGYAFPTVGSRNISATYAGDNNFTPSTSTIPFQQVVNATGTTITLNSDTGKPLVNQSVNFTATISFTSGAAIPTGTMAFVDNLTGATLCSETLVGGVAQPCPAAFTTATTHPITANYTSGDANFQSGTSNVVNQAVFQDTSTIAMPLLPSASVNQPIKFMATIAPTFTGVASPTGTVTFSVTTGPVTLPVLCSGNVAANVASCVATLPQTGSYGISATYNGDSNFAVSATAQTDTQMVTKDASTIQVFSIPTTSEVNQPVALTAVLTPVFLGTTIPSGKISFVSNGQALCSPVPVTAGNVTGTVMATCTTAALPLGADPIEVVYSGDGNFAQSVKPFLQDVQKATTMLTLMGTAPLPVTPISVATESIVVQATVAPAFELGAAVPSQTVTFTASDRSAAVCAGVSVRAQKDGTATASCTITFPIGDNGPVTITAAYSGDANFIGSSTTLVQTVQNFNIAWSNTGPIEITQGSSNGTDHFHASPINAVSTPLSGFADTLLLTCTVTNSAGAVVSDPTCAPSAGAPTLLNTGTAPVTLGYSLTASATAPVGEYTVTLTAVDSTTPALTHTAAALTIDVTGQAGALSLAPGAIGSENVTFSTAPLPTPTSAAPTSLTNFTCGSILDLSTGLPVNNTGIACSGPSSVNVNGNSVTVSISIATKANTGTTAVPARHGAPGVGAAAFWAIPLFALLAWMGNRNSPRRSFLRFLGMLALLLAGISGAVGCGSGGFTAPPLLTTGGTPTGTYLVQVVATDNNNIQRSAVVPVAVSNVQAQTTASR